MAPCSRFSAKSDDEVTPELWEEVGRIFTLASRRPRSRRASYLDRVCRGQEALRREVETLLSQHDRRDGFLGQFSSAGGQHFGPYEILTQLGKGGMALVYLARDTRLGRLVALKFPPVWAIGDGRTRERLRHEARTAATLSHPNIVTIFDIGNQDGVDYIAMEHVPGKTLREITPRRGLASQVASDYALQLAQALDHAHRAGILHRDLKPSNVIVTGDAQLKLLDFGLASGLMDSGHAYGTRAYMSPEQLSGHDATERSEIFSFGLLLHQMLSGQHPFGRGRNTIIEQAIRFGSPRALPAQVPPPLASIVERCLDRDPAQRFESMAQVVDALQSAMRTLPDSPDDDVRKAERENEASRQVRAALRNITYHSVAMTAEAIETLTASLSNDVPAAHRRQIQTVLREFLIRLEPYRIVPTPVREVRIQALKLLRLAADKGLESVLKRDDLQMLDLYGMDFSGESLPEFSFKNSPLIEANFTGCNLTEATFAEAFIRNAKFNDAVLTNVDFSDADWFNAPGLSVHQMRAAKVRTLRPCPGSIDEMETMLASLYQLPARTWALSVQKELLDTWREYLRPDGLRDAVNHWLRNE